MNKVWRDLTENYLSVVDLQFLTLVIGLRRNSCRETS